MRIEFCRDGGIYETFERGGVTPVPARFFRRLKILDTGTPLPLALWLFRRDADHLARDATLLMLESWYVRRMLCRLTTQRYNQLTVDHLKQLKSGGDPDVVTLERLQRLEGDSFAVA